MAKIEKAANDLDFYKNRDDTHPLNLNYEPPVEDFYGPVATELRYCTDLICIFVWFVFFCFSFAYGFYATQAYQEFNLERLYRSKDFRTDLCGLKQLEKKPYAYFLDPDNLYDIAICVSECPSAPDYTQQICLYDVDGVTLLEDYCYDTYYTDPYLVYCMPIELGARRNSIEKIINTDIEIFKRIAGDFWINIELIIGAFAVQIIVGIIFVVILLGRRIAHMMVWAFVTGFCVAMVFLSQYLDQEKQNVIDRDCPQDIEDPYKCVTAHLYLLEVIKQALLYTIPVYVFFLLYNFHSILRMIQVMEKMLKPLRQMLHVLLVPFFVSILQAAFAIMFILLLVGGVNSGTTETVSAPTGFSSTSYRAIVFQIWQQRGFYVVLFFMFWTLLALYYYVRCFIACCCSVWYFSRDKNYLNAPMLRPLWYTIRYHMGSYLMGAILIPLFWIPNAIFYYWKQMLEAMPKKSFLLHILLFFSIPGFWFYEYVGKYITHRNFIHIAIFGESFWVAGQKVFYLRERNFSRIDMIRKTLGFVRLVGLLFISSSGSYLVYYQLYSNQILDRYVIDVKQAVFFPIVPAMFVFLVGMFISQNFSSTIDIVAEVMMFDLVADEEMFMGQQRFADQDMLDFANKYSKEKATKDFVITNQGKLNPMNENPNDNKPLQQFDLKELMNQDEEEPEEPEPPEPVPVEEPKEKSHHSDDDKDYNQGNELDLDDLGDNNNGKGDEDFVDELAQFNKNRVQDANIKKGLAEDVIILDRNKEGVDGAKKTDRKRF